MHLNGRMTPNDLTKSYTKVTTNRWSGFRMKPHARLCVFKGTNRNSTVVGYSELIEYA